MKKLYLISFNDKQNVLEEIVKRKIKVLFKTHNSVIISATEAEFNRLSKLGYRIHRINSNMAKIRGARIPILINKLKGDVELRKKETKNKSYYFLLKFIGPVQPAWLKKLKSAKINIAKSLADFSLIISGTSANVKKISSRIEILFVEPYHPILKIHPSLLGRRSSELKNGDLLFKNLDAVHFPSRKIEIVIFKPEEIKSILKKIKALGIKGKIVDKKVIHAEVGTLNIEDIAQIEGIDTIYPYQPIGTDNDTSAVITNVTTVKTNEDLDGRGQIVGVLDTGLDSGVDDATMHLDFQGRIVSITPKSTGATLDDPTGHGTHVAGTVCGNGSANAGAWAGVAPAAELAFIATETTPDDTGVMTDAFDTMISNGALVVNNSWGSGSNAAYNLWSEAIDEYIWNNRNFLTVFTAGNDGRDTNSDGLTDMDALRSTGAAKNCITVGGSENNRPAGSLPNGGAIGAVYSLFGSDANVAEPISSDDISDNPEGMHHRSSRGPTGDGRIKPDIVAPATNVLSVRSSVYDDTLEDSELNTYFPSLDPLSSLYAFSQGTSMAAPQITGMAVLIRQYLSERRGHNEPSAALIKAILINGAYEMLGQYNAAAVNPHNDAGIVPNSIQGWGRADIQNSLFPLGTGRIQFSDRLEFALMTGETKIFEVHVNDIANPMSVCMVYTDAPGPGIINQLYLQVEQPDGSFLDGDFNIDNTINPYADIAVNGVINNVQKVLVDAPAVGLYRIHIHAHSVTEGIVPSPRSDIDPLIAVQDFALVVANATGYSENPISVVQVFDRSGSMNTFGYADPAKQRAKEFADFLQINDKHAVVSFNAAALEEYPSTLISSSTDIEDAKDAIDAISIGGRTSVGSGVVLAQSLFAADGLPHAMVLFSDGFSNEPPYAIDPNDASAPIIDAAFLATDTVIHTIALGASADATRLSDIASLTGGSFYTIDSLANIFELNEIYYNIQSLTGGGVLIDYGTDIVTAADSDSDRIPDKKKNTFSRTKLVSRPILGIPVPNIFLDHPILKLGSKKEISFTVDLSQQIRICISTNDNNVDFNFFVYDPNGNVYSNQTKGLRYIAGQDYKHLIIERPIHGIWKLKVQSFLSADFKFSYAIFSQALSDLEVDADEYVKENTNPRLDIRANLGDFIVTNQNVKVLTKGYPKISTIIKNNKSKIGKVKINKKVFGDPVDSKSQLQILNQTLKRSSSESLSKMKTNLKTLKMKKDKGLQIELPKMNETEALRHDISVSGSYNKDGQVYSFTRKKLICQQVRTKVPSSGILKIDEIWSSYSPSKTNNNLRHQKIINPGKTIVGIKVIGPKGRPVKLSDNYKFSAAVTINNKKIPKLRWVYEKTSQSFVTELPKGKGLVSVTAKIKVKSKISTKKLSWKQ